MVLPSPDRVRAQFRAIPSAPRRSFLERESRFHQAAHNRQNWDAVRNYDGPLLEDPSQHIPQPVLTLWCKEDRVFHVPGATVLTDALQNPTLKHMDNCGHLPLLDRPSDNGRILAQLVNK